MVYKFKRVLGVGINDGPEARAAIKDGKIHHYQRAFDENYIIWHRMLSTCHGSAATGGSIYPEWLRLTPFTRWLDEQRAQGAPAGTMPHLCRIAAAPGNTEYIGLYNQFHPLTTRLLHPRWVKYFDSLKSWYTNNLAGTTRYKGGGRMVTMRLSTIHSDYNYGKRRQHTVGIYQDRYTAARLARVAKSKHMRQMAAEPHIQMVKDLLNLHADEIQREKYLPDMTELGLAILRAEQDTGRDHLVASNRADGFSLEALPPHLCFPPYTPPTYTGKEQAAELADCDVRLVRPY